MTTPTNSVDDILQRCHDWIPYARCCWPEKDVGDPAKVAPPHTYMAMVERMSRGLEDEQATLTAAAESGGVRVDG